MEANEPRKAGLSRRDLIKRGAIVGGIAWTAPVIMSATSRAGAQVEQIICSGIKITTGGAINTGNVALCPTFDTGGPDLSCLVTGFQLVELEGSPSGGIAFQVCGVLATNLSGIAGKSAGNFSGCEILFNGVPAGNGASCKSSVNSNGDAFTSGRHDLIPFVIDEEPGGADCPAELEVDDGFVFIIGAIGGSVPEAGLGVPGAGCRWIVMDTTPNVNEMGLQACFPFGSVPPPCPN